MSAAGQFSEFVVIWRLVVFRNISQRFDSITGMLSMTLVWNQRTTLENEGGGGKRTFKEEPLVRVNQQARGAVTPLQAPPTPKTQNTKLQLPALKPVWQFHYASDSMNLTHSFQILILSPDLHFPHTVQPNILRNFVLRLWRRESGCSCVLQSPWWSSNNSTFNLGVITGIIKLYY